MPCSVMYIRPFACFISRFLPSLELSNKFRHTVFRHARSSLYQCLGRILTNDYPTFFLHIPSSGEAWGGRFSFGLALLL